MNAKERRPDTKAASPLKARRSSPALNIGLIAIAAAWLAILAHNGDPRIERWLAASVLAIVGVTGVLRIGAKRPNAPAADAPAPDAEG